MSAAPTRPTPYLKWAGGKSQLLDRIRERLPDTWGTYYEPFLGAGAVLFGISPARAIVGDLNAQLIATYTAIRDDVEGVMAEIDALDDGLLSGDPKSWYYEVRDRYNAALADAVSDVQMTAMFIFLNKHCFNGLYRVNARGLFNVPYNTSTRPSYDVGNLRAVSACLQGVDIACRDFEETCEGAGPGDFVFFDSPYAPIGDASFEAYTKEGFAKEEHERLAALYRKLDERGCMCMLTNHNTEFIRDLYEGFAIETVGVKRMINSDASKRTGEEVIVRNYG